MHCVFYGAWFKVQLCTEIFLVVYRVPNIVTCAVVLLCLCVLCSLKTANYHLSVSPDYRGSTFNFYKVYDLSFDLLLFTVSFPWHIYEITSCLSYLAILLIEVFECFAWGKAIKIFVH